MEWVANALASGPDDPTERFVYLVIGERVYKDNTEGHTYFGSMDLMNRTKLSESTIRRAIASLEKAGWLRVVRGLGKHKVSHYYLNKAPSRHLLEGIDNPPLRHLIEDTKGVMVAGKRCRGDDEKVSPWNSKGVMVTNPPHPLIGSTGRLPENNQIEAGHAPSDAPLLITRHMIAKEVCSRLKITDDEVYRQVAEQAKLEIGDGCEPDQADMLTDQMVKAWETYKASLQKIWGNRRAKEFFSEGMWRDQSTWPWKELKSSIRPSGTAAAQAEFAAKYADAEDAA